MTIPSEGNRHYIGEEKAAVNAAKFTRLVLLEAFEEEGLWLPVLAAQCTSHEIAHGRSQDLQDCSLTRSAPLRGESLTSDPKYVSFT